MSSVVELVPFSEYGSSDVGFADVDGTTYKSVVFLRYLACPLTPFTDITVNRYLNAGTNFEMVIEVDFKLSVPGQMRTFSHANKHCAMEHLLHKMLNVVSCRPPSSSGGCHERTITSLVMAATFRLNGSDGVAVERKIFSTLC